MSNTDKPFPDFKVDDPDRAMRLTTKLVKKVLAPITKPNRGRQKKHINKKNGA